MENKIFWLGIIGSLLFVLTAIIGAYLAPNYSHVEHLISESYAIDMAHGFNLRVFGYIPSSICLTLFGFLALKILPKSNLINLGFIGFAVFYGIGTFIVSVFPCDAGCDKELISPSLSQIIHNISGGLTYLLVPICLILIGIAMRKFPNQKTFSGLSILLGSIAMLFSYIFIEHYETNQVGLYQRVIEACVLIWVIKTSFVIKNFKQN
ncbi:uncharacterized protein DUF998 [Flavobacteriaceae bacterium MAR_2010_105]|nr:uncharacterized protein DUF998 [Flavobacteriaceae bacterium MAR_2010_105]